MKKITFILLFILLWFANKHSCFSQQWVPLNGNTTPQKPSCSVSEFDDYYILIDVEIFGFYSEEVIENDSIFHKISLPEYFTNSDSGKPALPIISKLIQIPENSSFSITIENDTIQYLNGFNVYPYQPDLFENEEIEEFYLDSLIYISNLYYPENKYSFSESFTIRDIQVIRMALNPIRFNPSLNRLEITSSFQIRIEFNSQFNYVSTKHSKSFDKIFSNLLLNYTSQITQDPSNSEDYNLLIISPEEYINHQDSKLNEFINWKNQKGYKTKVMQIGFFYSFFPFNSET